MEQTVLSANANDRSDKDALIVTGHSSSRESYGSLMSPSPVGFGVLVDSNQDLVESTGVFNTV